MASPEINQLRQDYGMAPEPPHFVDTPYPDAQTIYEITQNEIIVVYNAAELGLTSAMDASAAIDQIEKVRILAGDGWFDRYGPPPDELLYLYTPEERYWLIDPKDRV